MQNKLPYLNTTNYKTLNLQFISLFINKKECVSIYPRSYVAYNILIQKQLHIFSNSSNQFEI